MLADVHLCLLTLITLHKIKTIDVCILVLFINKLYCWFMYMYNVLLEQPYIKHQEGLTFCGQYNFPYGTKTQKNFLGIQLNEVFKLVFPKLSIFGSYLKDRQ